MKKSIFLIVILVILLPGLAQAKILYPRSGHPTAFAIIVDQNTYEKTQPAIEAYRNAVEADGMAVYVVYDRWETPEQVRKVLEKLYKRKPLLEGAVFIGDIPVVLIRNAQHLTTAFKMDEDAFPIQESSVPSDRYYDDLHLTFDYLCRDSVHSNHFYYRLREDSPQQLNPTFYSARIRYPEQRGGDPYEAIAQYLYKVVHEKQQPNLLDCFTSFTGNAYNSECLLAWMDEQLALQESFPLAWKSSRTAKFLNFRMKEYMKFQLFDELQRKELDVMLFHEHGAPGWQYICDVPAPGSMAGYVGSLRTYLYSKVRQEIKRGKGTPEEITAYFARQYDLNPSFFARLNDPEWWKADSVSNANTGIGLEDLRDLKTNSRFVMLDACYNGSFHLPGYVAGYYLFNGGNTVAVQANSRNVLQDRWTIEMIGLLTQGIRVGQWNRQIATLEGHLMGDPTFHFTPAVRNSLGVDMVVQEANRPVWEAYLDSPYADVQALAWRKLVDLDVEKKMSSRLLEVFRESPWNTVRMEALKLLSRYANEDFVEAVRLGLYDAYELIRRNAASYAGKCGDPRLIDDMVNVWLNAPESRRVCDMLQSAAYLMPVEKMVAALKAQYGDPQEIKDGVYARKKEKIDDYIQRLTQPRNNRVLTMSLLPDVKMPLKKQISLIRNVRNFPYHFQAEEYLKLLENEAYEVEARVNMAEALGWFNYSYRKTEIKDALEKMLKAGTLPPAVRLEVKQTINRLK